MPQQVDTVRIMCPALTCRRILAVPVSSRGKNVRCKSCGATIRVPEKSAAPVLSLAPASAAPADQGTPAQTAKPAA